MPCSVLMETSCFSMLSYIDYPVSISLYPPRYYVERGLPEFKILAPTRELLYDYKALLCNEREYIERYNSYLKTLDPHDVVANLKLLVSSCFSNTNISESDITLLCYEPKGQFCHRRLVAKWLTDNGYPTNERGGRNR